MRGNEAPAGHAHGAEARAVQTSRAVQTARAEWEPWGGARAVPEEVQTRAVPEEVQGTRDGEERSAVREAGKAGARRAESGEEGPMKVEELVETVYELLVRRLRADSRLDRERRGLSMGSRF
ncbi:hypothetical protein ACFWYW_10100 [Nonomuraea sp. NPDC059023]|uniref:hypothetical protein n=1 Tax=unclassified Nonomuraea TaxID=2593643 RepID=UPI0036C287BA